MLTSAENRGSSHESLDGVDAVEQACARASRLIEAGVTQHEVLTALATAAEHLLGPGTTVSILVLDENGLLRNGASPNLPPDYLRAIDGLKPDANIGTCAAVAATGAMVITHDFLADSKWAELRHLPLALGFVGAWSLPIKARGTDAVLGTFGTYCRELCEPSAREIAIVARLADVAARALEATDPD